MALYRDIYSPPHIPCNEWNIWSGISKYSIFEFYLWCCNVVILRRSPSLASVGDSIPRSEAMIQDVVFIIEWPRLHNINQPDGRQIDSTCQVRLDKNMYPIIIHEFSIKNCYIIINPDVQTIVKIISWHSVLWFESFSLLICWRHCAPLRHSITTKSKCRIWYNNWKI